MKKSLLKSTRIWSAHVCVLLSIQFTSTVGAKSWAERYFFIAVKLEEFDVEKVSFQAWPLFSMWAVVQRLRVVTSWFVFQHILTSAFNIQRIQPIIYLDWTSMKLIERVFFSLLKVRCECPPWGCFLPACVAERTPRPWKWAQKGAFDGKKRTLLCVGPNTCYG